MGYKTQREEFEKVVTKRCTEDDRERKNSDTAQSKKGKITK